MTSASGSESKSKVRWKDSKPDRNLTWGKLISGDAFVEKADKYGVFGKDNRIVEVGPGYGRLLASIVSKSLPFRSYTGLDISEKSVRHLSEKYSSDDRIKFLLGDVEKVTLDSEYDSLISSLTFKHLYPTFERGLANVTRFVKPEGIVCFDLIEFKWSGPRKSWFEEDGVTYIRKYSKSEVKEILARVGFRSPCFDYVRHDPNKTRLLVVARKH